MLLPLTKRAGVVDSTIKVLSHPATMTAAPLIAAGVPIAAEAMRKKEPEPQPHQQVRVAHLLPSFVTSIYKRAGLIDGAAKLIAKPAVQLAMNVAPTVMSMMGSKAPPPAPAARPAGPEGSGAAPSGSFSRPQQAKMNSVTTTPAGPIDMSQQITPVGAVPSTRGNPTPTAHMDGSSQGSPTTSAGMASAPISKGPASAAKAFKVAGLLDSPKLDRYLNIGSQAAVIGSAALPFYSMWADHQKQKGRDEMMDPAMELRAIQTARQPHDDLRKVSMMLPLKPKMPMMDRLGAGVRDFGEGAYDELDNQAGKLLQPETRLDPIKTRTPPFLHKI